MKRTLDRHGVMNSSRSPRSRLRVLFVDQIPTPYRTPFYGRLSVDSRYQIRVVYCGQPPEDRGWGEQPLVFPHRFLRGLAVPGPDHGQLYANPEVLSEVRANADVVVISGWLHPTCVLAAVVARAGRIPYVIASESRADRHRSQVARLARTLVFRPVVRGAAAGLATGSLARDYLIELGARESSVFIFPNACDVDRIITSSDAARRNGEAVHLREQLAGTKPLVLFVGRLIPTKAVPTLLDAVEILNATGTQVACAIAGDGRERGALERRVLERRLPDISFLGEVLNDDLPALYAAAHVLCLPSVEEPWGVVVNEALSAGCPVVASNSVGAGADLIRSGENGATFPAFDAVALAHSIEDLIRLEPQATIESARSVARSWDYRRMQAGLDQALSEAVRSRR